MHPIALILAAALLTLITMLLITTEDLRFLHGLFLAVSSFATVGLSPVDIATLSASGKVLLMALMLIGKLGVPLLFLLLLQLQREPAFEYPEEQVNLA